MLRSWRLRRHLHWWTVAFLGLGFPIAWIMTSLPLTLLLIKFLLYQVHKSLGLLILCIVIARLALIWRVTGPPRGQRAALFSLLLVVPVLGYLTATTSPTPVPTMFLLLLPVPHLTGPNPAAYEVVRQLHQWLAIALVGLGCWHGMRAWRVST